MLDATFKSSILLWFSSLLLEDYVALYAFGKDGATLDQIDRRYAWCRRMIRAYDDTYLPVFPSEWEMPCYIANHFCKMTKGQPRHTPQRYLSRPSPYSPSSTNALFPVDACAPVPALPAVSTQHTSRRC